MTAKGPIVEYASTDIRKADLATLTVATGYGASGNWYITPGSKLRQIISCEKQPAVKISCENESNIKIESALYQQVTTLSDTRCTTTVQNQTCDQIKDLTEFCGIECDGKQNCQFKGTNEFAGDPCVGSNKYTRILYTCIKEQKKCSSLWNPKEKSIPSLNCLI